MPRKRKPRVIDILRKAYPGEWRYMGAGEWDGPDFIVYAVRYGAGAYNGDEPSKLDLGSVHYYRTDVGGARDRLVPELIGYGE